MLYDVAIIGGGPAGLTAAIYATRANLKTIVFEKAICGGQIVNAMQVDNYPALPHISGAELGERLENQAKELGAEIVFDEVSNFAKEGDIFKLSASEEYTARSVVLATGAAPRKLDIPGEKELIGRGVSLCATCDGGFFKGKNVAVIGGGDAALADAIYLSGICNKAYLVHRRDEFRGKASMVEKLKNIPNVEFVLKATPEQILGESRVEGLEIKQDEQMKKLDVEGVFVAIGQVSQGARLNTELKADSFGYLIADENLQSSIPGVFLAGDLRQKRTRQLTTATADGSEAIASVSDYLSNKQ